MYRIKFTPYRFPEEFRKKRQCHHGELSLFKILAEQQAALEASTPEVTVKKEDSPTPKPVEEPQKEVGIHLYYDLIQPILFFRNFERRFGF